MHFLIILCAVLKISESLIVNDTTPANRNVDTRSNRIKTIKYVTLPTEKCANITLTTNKTEEEACREYCKGLKKEFFDGECLDGTCNCKVNVSAIVVEKTRDKGKAVKESGRQGVKCKSLIRFRGQIGPENHKGCGVHCRLLNTENKDGRCVDGVCQCTTEVKKEKADEEEEEEDEVEEDECRKDEDCETGCTGRNREPRCMSGICRCRITPPQPEPINLPGFEREVKKCEHRRTTVNNEICRSHCEEFSRDHREGTCVDGVCQCGYAVFELMDAKSDEAEKKKKTRKMRGRSRGRA